MVWNGDRFQEQGCVAEQCVERKPASEGWTKASFGLSTLKIRHSLKAIPDSTPSAFAALAVARKALKEAGAQSSENDKAGDGKPSLERPWRDWGAFDRRSPSPRALPLPQARRDEARSLNAAPSDLDESPWL